MTHRLDNIDCRILEELQRDATQSQRALADKVGLSQNACWRRLKTLESSGVIRGRTVIIDRDNLLLFQIDMTEGREPLILESFERERLCTDCRVRLEVLEVLVHVLDEVGGGAVLRGTRTRTRMRTRPAR